MEETPISNGKKGRDEKGRFVEGWEGGPGRPAGKLSITEAQQAYYREHPEEFDKLLADIRKDKMLRKLIWNYFDGLPKQPIEHQGEITTYVIKRGRSNPVSATSETGTDNGTSSTI